MAKVKDNLVTEGASGRLGKRLVFRYMKDGRTISATRPDHTSHEWTAGQQTHYSRFQRAASKTNPLYAELAAGTAKNAYNLALSNWFHPPVIHQVMRQAGSIRVDATDNVQVANVLVTILDGQGKTLEQGQALLAKSGWWEYVMAASIGRNIIVEAFDLAGNKTQYTM